MLILIKFLSVFSLICFCLSVKMLSLTISDSDFDSRSKPTLPISEAICKRSRPVNHWLCLTSQQMCYWNRCLHLKVTHIHKQNYAVCLRMHMLSGGCHTESSREWQLPHPPYAAVWTGIIKANYHCGPWII